MAKPGVQTRRVAVRLLDEVLAGGRALSELDALYEPLVPAERARAQRLATTTLRHLARADALLEPFLRKPPPVFALNLLRLATVELCHDRAAAHGVVDSAVSVIRGNRRMNHLSGLVNAVLRKVTAEGPARWADLPPSQIPPWLRGRLVATYGEDVTRAIEEVQALSPPTDLTPNALKFMPEIPGGAQLPTGSLRLSDPGQISALPGYGAGAWWVQDAAAALPARLLDAQEGEAVLDLCAAPGGKTLQLAATGAGVTAVDLSEHRMARVRQNLKRTGLKAEIVVANALKYSGGPFDAILLDAPCSATGTMRRHPDLPHVKETRDLSTITRLQSNMLDHALGLLKPGGRLVFCTCSLLPDEGEEQVTAALARHSGLKVDPASLPGVPDDWRGPEGGFRIRPDFWAGNGGIDGFYFAQLRY
ncbi:MAG: RsmB/NOP family class I SAM-dependent RNA methyltransferase [Brevirhabdus sp.]